MWWIAVVLAFWFVMDTNNTTLLLCCPMLLLYLWWKPQLTDATLRDDLRSLQHALGAAYEDAINKNFEDEAVVKYYEHTTHRDYRWLQWIMGPGMHTQLQCKSPASSCGAGTRQVMFLLAEIRSSGALSVLEIGCGRGYCSLALAAAAPDVLFVGVDILESHIDEAMASARLANLSNVTFEVADATNMDLGVRFDLVFGCESLCHMDSVKKRRSCFASIVQHLCCQGGHVVIVDGFRSSTFHVCSHQQRVAMLLAESGFRIRAMPSRADWKAMGHEFGFQVAREQDLTDEALPFWTMGWRMARLLLSFPSLIRWYGQGSPKRHETIGSLTSVATVAHAMRNKAAAEYGLLVLTV